MKKRTLGLGLLLLATFLAEGCCWPHRPFLFRRWYHSGCCEPACCGTSYFGGPACCTDGPIVHDAHAVPPAMIGPAVPLAPEGGPRMPGAAPLTRARFAQK